MPKNVNTDIHNKIFTFIDSCIQNNGRFLFVTAAIGSALSSAAQTMSLIADKNISKEDKKFLVPQEIFDGAFNILACAAISIPMMIFAKKWAGNKFPDNEKAIGGAGVIAAIAGGVISNSIVTPILRNKCSVMMKEHFEERNKNKLDITSNSYNQNFSVNNPYASVENFKNFTKNPALYSGGLKI